MARGKHSGRGGNGSNRGGHRGRGFAQNGRGRGRGGYNPVDDLDFTIYDYDKDAARGGFGGGSGSGFNSPRGRGRGRGSGYSTPRGGPSTPFRGGYNTPRGGFNGQRGGYDSSRGRGRGRKPIYKPIEDYDIGMGRGSPKHNSGPYRGQAGKNWQSRMKAGVSLSKLLSEDRPLLRPVIFVRSVYTATLFEEKEEILKPLAEEATNDEKSHVPTADQVTRVFSGKLEDDDEGDDEDEGLEEIDFSDIGRLQAQVDAAAVVQSTQETSEVTVVEQKFTGFYIDTKPSTFELATSASRTEGLILGDDDDDDEVIVYIAPHPRAGPVTPPETPRIPSPMVPEASGAPSILSERDSPPEVTHGEDMVATEPFSKVTGVEESPRDALLSTVLQSDVVMTSQELVDTVQVPSDTPTVEMTVPPAPIKSELETVRVQTSEVENMAEDVPMAQNVVVPVAAVALEDLARTSVTAQALEVLTAPLELASASSPSFGITEKEDTTVLTHEATDAAAGSTESVPQQTPAFEEVTFSALKTTVTQRRMLRRAHPVHTPRSLIKKNKPRRKALRGFGLYGASLAEAHLQEDARKAERRIGDSDLDWGSGSDDADVDELSASVGAMDIDEDIDIAAMSSFVKSMSAGGSRHVTMDDIADTETMRKEDEEDADSEDSEDEDEGVIAGTDDGDEDVMKTETSMLLAEANKLGVSSEDSDEDYSTDEEGTPRRCFEARVKRMREKSTKGKDKADATPEADEEDVDDSDDYDMELEQSWADNDEAYIDHIQATVDANKDPLSRKDRKLRDNLFRTLQNGDFDLDDYEEFASQPARRNKDKYKDLSPDLQEQWAKDREKKAENKRKRALDRLAAAADPLSEKKGGKKGMKAALAAARYDGEAIEIPNRIVDLATLEQQIRRFLADIGGRREMVLPPCGKATREKIHKLAEAFSLKSKSKGKGNTRYTTLTKTTKSGVGVNERKIRRILKSVGADWIGPDGTGGKRAYSLAKHREGEEVGKAAPKIGETNIGFKMLAAMGWSEGNQIGLSGGLDAPLVAKMKKTKLGLGATL